MKIKPSFVHDFSQWAMRFCLDTRWLNFSVWRVSLFVLLGISVAALQAATLPENALQILTLTNASQIRALTPLAAAQNLPVRLRGVVLNKHSHGAFIIMDAAAGLYA